MSNDLAVICKTSRSRPVEITTPLDGNRSAIASLRQVANKYADQAHSDHICCLCGAKIQELGSVRLP